jgi:hypothetical protein
MTEPEFDRKKIERRQDLRDGSMQPPFRRRCHTRELIEPDRWNQ